MIDQLTSSATFVAAVPVVVTTSAVYGSSLEWVRDLRRIVSYQDDWDGNGAVAPSPEVLRTVRQFMDRWSREDRLPPGRIVASPAGSVVLEWREGGRYLEAEIDEPGTIEWMLEAPDGSFSHWKTLWPAP
jgi:hypothetical protein